MRGPAPPSQANEAGSDARGGGGPFGCSVSAATEDPAGGADHAAPDGGDAATGATTGAGAEGHGHEVEFRDTL